MGNKVLHFTVSPDDEGVRLDRFCAARLENLSRNQIQKLNTEGRITVDAAPRSHHYALSTGERIEIELPEPASEAALPSAQDIPLRILYEDDNLVVVNKEPGMVVHPAHGNPDGTLVNALLGRGTTLAALGGPERPGIVHRLDKDTSGLIVVARNDAAYSSLSTQIRERSVQRVYHAIIWGTCGADTIEIDEPIGRHPVNRKKMAVVQRGGKKAVTRIFVMDSFHHFEYIRVVLETGRTHQIRVHLSNMSNPILGDPVYGGRRKTGSISGAHARGLAQKLLKTMARPALHASSLEFTHPMTGRRLFFQTALPGDMRSALEALFINDLVQGG